MRLLVLLTFFFEAFEHYMKLFKTKSFSLLVPVMRYLKYRLFTSHFLHFFFFFSLFFIFLMALHFFFIFDLNFGYFFKIFDHKVIISYFECTYCFGVCISRQSIHATLLTFGCLDFTCLKIVVHQSTRVYVEI